MTLWTTVTVWITTFMLMTLWTTVTAWITTFNYADDLQLLNSALVENIHTILKPHLAAIWTSQTGWHKPNQLNGEVTDALLLGTRQKLFIICANALQLGNIWWQSHSLTLSKALAFSASTALSMENFISQTSKSCYYQLGRISSVRKYLSIEASVKLVTSFILLRLDYCNFHLSGLLASSVHTFVASRTVLLASSGGGGGGGGAWNWPYHSSVSVSSLARNFCAWICLVCLIFTLHRTEGFEHSYYKCYKNE